MVWVLYPGEIKNGPAYGQFIAEVLRHEFPFPWCHHIRIIVREEPTQPALDKMLGKAPRIAWYEPDLSTAALEKATAEEVDDECLPLNERLQALLVTAATDYSHRRYDLALAKYQLLFKHYSATGNLILTAVALNGMGEVYREQGDKQQAGACFEAAVVPASEGSPPPAPVLFNITLNLGNLRMEEKRWAEAEGYYDCAQQLATLLSGEVKIMVLEQFGVARYQQKDIPGALEAWKAGVIVAGKINKPELGENQLRRLRDHFAKIGDKAGLRDLERELAAAQKAVAKVEEQHVPAR